MTYDQRRYGDVVQLASLEGEGGVWARDRPALNAAECLSGFSLGQMVELVTKLKKRGLPMDEQLEEILNRVGLVVYDLRGGDCKIAATFSLLEYFVFFAMEFEEVQEGFSPIGNCSNNGGGKFSDVLFIID